MITISYLHKHLRYDPSTGALWWKLPLQGRRLYRPAGRRSKSRHVTIGIGRQQYMAHRIIWALQTGKWPRIEIDHKNRKRADNRWVNLREATTPQNRWNASKRSDNTSGYKGVSWMPEKRKWRARLWVSGKEKHLGLFPTKKIARQVFIQAAIANRGEFAHV